MKNGLTPHGPGFSFVDEVEILEAGKRLRAGKWLDPKLPFFADHFPGTPMMPGVLLVECAAQAAGYLWGSIHGSKKPERYALAQVLQFKLLKPVLPGDTVIAEVELDRDFGSLAQFAAILTVEAEPVAQGKVILSRTSPPAV